MELELLELELEGDWMLMLTGRKYAQSLERVRNAPSSLFSLLGCALISEDRHPHRSLTLLEVRGRNNVTDQGTRGRDGD